MKKSGLAVVALAGMLAVFAPAKAAARDWDDYYGGDRHERHERAERWRRHEAHEWREHERREHRWREHEWRERRGYSAPYGYYQNGGGYYQNGYAPNGGNPSGYYDAYGNFHYYGY